MDGIEIETTKAPLSLAEERAWAELNTPISEPHHDGAEIPRGIFVYDRTPPLTFPADPAAVASFSTAMNEAQSSTAAYELLLNQLAQMRTIADKAAHAAIGNLDLSECSDEDCRLIDTYIQGCGYIDAGVEDDRDLRTVLITEVLQPLTDPATAGVTDYLSLSRRELSRKQRIKDELGQLQVMADAFDAHADVPSEILIELAAARMALLYASSDVLDHGLLMTLSPAVRIAQRLAEMRERTKKGVDIDWSGVDGTPSRKSQQDAE